MEDPINSNAPVLAPVRLGVLALLAPDVGTLARLPHLKAAHPGVAIEVIYDSASALETELIAGSLACAVVEETWPSAFLDFKPWPQGGGNHSYAVVAKAPAPKTMKAGESKFSVQATPLIDSAADLPRLGPWLQAVAPAQEAAAARATWIVPSEGAMLALVLAGAGIAALPRQLVRDALDSHALVELTPETPPPKRPRHLAIRRANTRQLSELLLIEHLLDPT